MEKLKQITFSKYFKSITLIIFFLGSLVGTFFVFNNYIYSKDKYTGKTSIETSSDFNSNYEFLVEVDSNYGFEYDIDHIANIQQENLNYLGFQEAIVNVESDNQFRVSIPLAEDFQEAEVTDIDQQIKALNIFFTGDIQISFLDSNGISLFDDRGNYNSSASTYNLDDVPNMVEPNSAKFESINGSTVINFRPSNGENGKKAFQDAMNAISQNPAPGESSEDGSSEDSSTTNEITVWINYNKLYDFISFVDPDGLSNVSNNLLQYCIPTDAEGNQTFKGSFKPVCDPYLVTSHQAHEIPNDNFKFVQLHGPIPAGSETTFDLDLAKFFVNQFNESSSNYNTKVIYNGWTSNPFNQDDLTLSFIIFAIIIMIFIIIVIAFYGMSGLVSSIIATIIYMLSFLVLFASGVQFSFATSAAIFIFVMIDLIMLSFISKRFKERTIDSRKTMSQTFKDFLRNDSSLVAIFSLIMLIFGFISYTFGYQQIALIGTLAFLSSLFFIALFIILLIPLYFYISEDVDLDKLKEKKYSILLGFLKINEPKIMNQKEIENRDIKKSKSLKFISIFSFIFLATTITFFVLSATLGQAPINNSLSSTSGLYRYDLISDQSFKEEDDLTNLDYISDDEANNVISTFEQYTKVNSIQLTIVQEYSCTYEDIEISGSTEDCYIESIPSIAILTSNALNQSDLLSIIDDLNNDDFTSRPTEDEFYEPDYKYTYFDSNIYTSEIDPTFYSSYSFEYWVNNAFVIASISFAIIILFYFIVSKSAGMFAGGWSLIFQFMASFSLMFIFFLPMSDYVVFAMLFSFSISAFTKFIFLQVYKRKLNSNKVKVHGIGEIEIAIKNAQNETKYITLITNSLLVIFGIVLTGFLGLSQLPVLIYSVISFVMSIVFDIYLMPILLKWSEVSASNVKAKNIKKDMEKEKNQGLIVEDLVEDINY